MSDLDIRAENVLSLYYSGYNDEPDTEHMPDDVRRIQYYNPLLDPHVVATKMTADMREAVEQGKYNDGTAKGGGPLHTPDDSHSSNLISSLCTDGKHRPLLDLDFGTPLEFQAKLTRALPDKAIVLLLRSSVHWHAYVPNLTYGHSEYFDLLDDLVGAKLLEVNYVAASRGRGQTLLRPPGTYKEGAAVEIFNSKQRIWITPPEQLESF